MDKPADWIEASVAEKFTLGRGRVISHQEIRDKPGNYPVYSSQSFNKGEMGRIATYDFQGESVTWTTDGAYAGTVFYRNGRYNCTNVCGIAKPKGEASGIDLRYSAYFLSTVAKMFVSYHGNPKLMNNIFGEIPIALPPLPEQKKIAEILSSVDDLIEKTERLIAKLQELKKAMLQELLTKGIGHTNFKDSPVGRIPEEWEIVRLDSIASLQLGKMLSKASKTGQNTYPYLTNRNVQWGRIDLSDLEEMDFDEGERKKFSLEKGDLLVCEGGEVGRASLWGSERKNVFYQKALHRVRVNRAYCLPQFLLFWIWQTMTGPGLRHLVGQTSIAHLTQENLQTIPVPLPFIQEQDSICKAIHAVSEEEASVMLKHTAHSHMKSALMQDLLTGKVRVKV